MLNFLASGNFAKTMPYQSINQSTLEWPS